MVGYNARGVTYRNHPAAGFDIGDTAVACPNDILYKVPWHNLIYKISPPQGFLLEQEENCMKFYLNDIKRWSKEVNQYADKLEPCPCGIWQAWWDSRFHWEFSTGLCFVQRFSVNVNWMGAEGRFTQRCCYGFWGYVRISK